MSGLRLKADKADGPLPVGDGRPGLRKRNRKHSQEVRRHEQRDFHADSNDALRGHRGGRVAHHHDGRRAAGLPAGHALCPDPDRRGEDLLLAPERAG